jgi:hypothetical protein
MLSGVNTRPFPLPAAAPPAPPPPPSASTCLSAWERRDAGLEGTGRGRRNNFSLLHTSGVHAWGGVLAWAFRAAERDALLRCSWACTPTQEEAEEGEWGGGEHVQAIPQPLPSNATVPTTHGLTCPPSTPTHKHNRVGRRQCSPRRHRLLLCCDPRSRLGIELRAGPGRRGQVQG